MIENIKFLAKAAVSDRKGATALEYALIAAAVAAVVGVGFNTFYTNLTTYLGGISY